MRRTLIFALCVATTGVLSVVASPARSFASGPPGTVSIGDVKVWEGDNLPPDRVHNAVVAVTLAGPLLTDETVAYAVTGGTATAGAPKDAIHGADYQAKSGTLKFPHGVVVKNIVLKIYGDVRYDDGETIQLTLSNPSSGLTIGRATGTITIDENDGVENPGLIVDPDGTARWNLEVSSPTVVEGDSKYRMVTFTVTLSYFCADAEVDYQLVAGTATGNWKGSGPLPPNTDFADKLGAVKTLTFPPHVVERKVAVKLAPDTTPGEGDEQFSLVLSNPSSGCAHGVDAGPPGVATIVDDDS